MFCICSFFWFLLLFFTEQNAIYHLCIYNLSIFFLVRYLNFQFWVMNKTTINILVKDFLCFHFIFSEGPQSRYFFFNSVYWYNIAMSGIVSKCFKILIHFISMLVSTAILKGSNETFSCLPFSVTQNRNQGAFQDSVGKSVTVTFIHIPTCIFLNFMVSIPSWPSEQVYFNVFKSWLPVFQSECKFHLLYIFVSPFSDFVILAVLVDVYWYIIIVLICISLLINDVKYLFMCLLVRHCSKCLMLFPIW